MSLNLLLNIVKLIKFAFCWWWNSLHVECLNISPLFSQSSQVQLIPYSPVGAIQSSRFKQSYLCHKVQSVPYSPIIVLLSSPCRARHGLTPVPDQHEWGHYKMRRQWKGGKEGSSSLSSFPLHLLLLMIHSDEKTGKEAVRRF